MDVEALLRELNDTGPYAHTTTGYWAAWPDLDVRAMAQLMRQNVVRLITITATPADGDTLRIIYHWDAGGELLNLSTTVRSGHAPTISDIVPGADWVEREIRDYYGPEFDGRATTPPLMLREGDPPGLFTRTREQGNEADPAQTAHDAIAAGERRPAAVPTSRTAGERRPVAVPTSYTADERRPAAVPTSYTADERRPAAVPTSYTAVEGELR